MAVKRTVATLDRGAHQKSKAESPNQQARPKWFKRDRFIKEVTRCRRQNLYRAVEPHA